MSQLRQTLQQSLHDPFSAQLVELSNGANGRVCGKLNARNRMGGYVGFRFFAFDPASARIVYLPDFTDFDTKATDAAEKLRVADEEIKFIGESCPTLK